MRIQEIIRQLFFGAEPAFAGGFSGFGSDEKEICGGRVTVSFFGGGGAPPVPKQPSLQLPPPPQFKVPEPPAPLPPPVVQSNIDEQQAKDDARLQAAKRKGIRSTLLAGNTGGYSNPATGSNSLLG